MKMVRLAHTELVVSRLCFGCWGIISDFHWGKRDQAQAIATLAAALDAGVNFFDTAAMYGDGASETLLGRFLAGRRESVIVASKIRPDAMGPSDVAATCEAALRRLQTDYIDLYQTHWTSRETPLADTWQAMLRLQQQGKVRYVGVCNMGAGDLDDVRSMQPPAANQLPYSLLWRAIEYAILPACAEHGIDCLAYSPLMHGMLAGKYRSADAVPSSRARSRHFGSHRPDTRHGEAGCEAETFAALDSIRNVCDRLDRSMADVALAWCNQRPGVASVIAGASTPEQLRHNAASFENPLPDAALAELDRVTEPLKQSLGSNPDMWQGRDQSRFR
jgi:aryl-alcohol dehydrogenase-like predicted oxidoreductase